MKPNAKAARFGRLPDGAYWQSRLEEECARTARYGRPFGVVLAELRGEDGTEPALMLLEGVERVIAETLRGTLRESDLLCRLSSGRYGILLVETDAAGTEAVARRLPGTVGREVVHCLPQSARPLLAVGFAVCPLEGDAPETLSAVAVSSFQISEHKIGRGSARRGSGTASRALPQFGWLGR